MHYSCMISPMRARVLAQKSEEATASSASLLATPMQSAANKTVFPFYVHPAVADQLNMHCLHKLSLNTQNFLRQGTLKCPIQTHHVLHQTESRHISYNMNHTHHTQPLCILQKCTVHRITNIFNQERIKTGG